jgi:hypothetical protein
MKSKLCQTFELIVIPFRKRLKATLVVLAFAEPPQLW